MCLPRSLMLFACFLPIFIRAAQPPQTREEKPDSTQMVRPEIFVTWTDKKIVVDGLLDEEAWQDAQVYEDYFFQQQPIDRAPSSEKTRVMVLQDDKMLYFGIQCFDSEPDKIFASAKRRDTNIWRDDVTELLLDTFNDNRNCYAFVTNPLGVKGDAIVSDQGNHVNLPWECVIYMDGARNENGWAAEFGVPFKSLKYKEGEVVDWGFNVTREIKHRQEKTYLAPIPRALDHMGKFRGEMWGRLRNIRPPAKGLNFELYPYLLGGRTNIYGDSPSRKNEFNSGVDFRYDVTTQLALDLTYRTDFAQAEAEEEIVNTTRFNIQRQEKREFFLQSAGLFQFGPGGRSQSNFTLFDSRTIGIKDGYRVPLIGGGKITGRAGKYSIAALNLQSEETDLADNLREPTTNFFAARVKRNVAKNSHIGFMALNKQASGLDYSRAFGLDGIWNVSDAVRLDASAAQAFSPNVNQRNTAADAGFTLNKEWVDLILRYTHIDSLFNPAMGFVRRPNVRHTNGSLTFTKWINGAVVQNVAMASGLSYITDHRQILQTRDNSYSLSVLTNQGDEIRLGVQQSFEFVPADDYIRNIKIGAGSYNSATQSISLNSYRARPFYANSTFAWGTLFDGRQQTVTVTGTAQFSKNLLVDLSYAYNDFDLKNGDLKSHVIATRWTYCFTTDLFAKAYVQWNTADERFSVNFLVDWSYKPRSHFYLVYNENQDTLRDAVKDRIVMLKMTYLWQI